MDNNFWDFVLVGLQALVDYIIVGIFPPHLNIGMAGALTSIAYNWVAMLFMVVASYVNIAVPVMVATIIGFLEAGKGVYAAWRMLLKALPGGG